MDNTRQEHMWQQLLAVKTDERPALIYAGGLFFSLLCGYYLIRPLREEMAITAGVETLQVLQTATFVAMLLIVPLFGMIAARLPRRQLFWCSYSFFIACILVFWWVFRQLPGNLWVARAYFVWLSVMNLFIISLFWSLMADLFHQDEAKRLFGLITVGGSLGGLAGPLLTSLLAERLGHTNLLLLAAVMLGLGIFFCERLTRWSVQRHAQGEQLEQHPTDKPALGGGVLAGFTLTLRSSYLLGICLIAFLQSSCGTFLYFQQAHIVANAYSDPAARTALFGMIDFAVNIVTLLMQVLLGGWLMRRWDVPATLALVPFLTALGFAGLVLAPVVPMLVGLQVFRRAGDYAILRPAREVLFTVVDRETKYKAKNFIDTAIFRGGDALNGWVFTGLKGLGLGLTELAGISVALGMTWAGIAYWLGRYHVRMVLEKSSQS